MCQTILYRLGRGLTVVDTLISGTGSPVLSHTLVLTSAADNKPAGKLNALF